MYENLNIFRVFLLEFFHKTQTLKLVEVIRILRILMFVPDILGV